MAERHNTMGDVKELTPQESMDGLRAAVKADPEYAYGWHSNIAMACYDAIIHGDGSEDDEDLTSAHIRANKQATAFMSRVFGVETKYPDID